MGRNNHLSSTSSGNGGEEEQGAEPSGPSTSLSVPAKASQGVFPCNKAAAHALNRRLFTTASTPPAAA